jgi:hypothetical protein
LNKKVVTPLTNELCTKLQNQELNNELDKLGIGPTINLEQTANSLSKRKKNQKDVDHINVTFRIFF